MHKSLDDYDNSPTRHSLLSHVLTHQIADTQFDREDAYLEELPTEQSYEDWLSSTQFVYDATTPLNATKVC